MIYFPFQNTYEHKWGIQNVQHYKHHICLLQHYHCKNKIHPAQYKLCSLNLLYCSHMLGQNNLLVSKLIDFEILLTFARIWKIIISIITLITSETNNQSFACTLTSSFVTNKSRRTILVTITFCKKEKFQLILKILNVLTKILLNH